MKKVNVYLFLAFIGALFFALVFVFSKSILTIRDDQAVILNYYAENGEEKISDIDSSVDIIDCGSVEFADRAYLMFNDDAYYKHIFEGYRESDFVGHYFNEDYFNYKMSPQSKSALVCINQALNTCSPAVFRVNGTNSQPEDDYFLAQADEIQPSMILHIYGVKDGFCSINDCLIPQEVIQNNSLVAGHGFVFSLLGLGSEEEMFNMNENDAYDPVTSQVIKGVCPEGSGLFVENTESEIVGDKNFFVEDEVIEVYEDQNLEVSICDLKNDPAYYLDKEISVEANVIFGGDNYFSGHEDFLLEDENCEIQVSSWAPISVSSCPPGNDCKMPKVMLSYLNKRVRLNGVFSQLDKREYVDGSWQVVGSYYAITNVKSAVIVDGQ